MRIGAAVKEARLKAGLSVGELARQLGICQSSLYAIENGKQSGAGKTFAILRGWLAEMDDESRAKAAKDALTDGLPALFAAQKAGFDSRAAMTEAIKRSASTCPPADISGELVLEKGAFRLLKDDGGASRLYKIVNVHFGKAFLSVFDGQQDDLFSLLHGAFDQPATDFYATENALLKAEIRAAKDELAAAKRLLDEAKKEADAGKQECKNLLEDRDALAAENATKLIELQSLKAKLYDIMCGEVLRNG